MKRLLAAFLALLCLTGDLGARRWIPKIAAASSNNIAIVNYGGAIADNATLVDTSTGMGANWSGSVTSGNVLIICVAQAADGWTPATGDLTKASGTATIGTIVLDNSRANPSSEIGFGIWRVPITGSGTIVMSCTNSGRAGNFWMIAAAEFSGFNASPTSTVTNNSGTGSVRTTGSITTTNPGVIIYIASGLNTTNYTDTNSDVLIAKYTDATSHMTGVAQYKLISSSPNTLTDTTGENVNWWVEAMAYKSN